MTVIRKGRADMTVVEALSQAPMAELITTKRRLIAADTATGIRIIRGVTDCTVVRKLTIAEQQAQAWEPIELELGQ